MFSRRSFMAGMASAVSTSGCTVGHGQHRSEAISPADAGALEASELATLIAITGRLIPSDETGPGAIEAHAAYYIDRALVDSLAPQRELYRSGLAAIDAYSGLHHGAAFVSLLPNTQDEVLHAVERGLPAELMKDSTNFFAVLRDHTLQGTFCDPYYGGNAGYVGWDLIGYPGLRMMVTREEQRINAPLPRVHGSAYDGDGYHRPDRGEHRVPGVRK